MHDGFGELFCNSGHDSIVQIPKKLLHSIGIGHERQMLRQSFSNTKAMLPKISVEQLAWLVWQKRARQKEEYPMGADMNVLANIVATWNIDGFTNQNQKDWRDTADGFLSTQELENGIALLRDKLKLLDLSQRKTLPGGVTKEEARLAMDTLQDLYSQAVQAERERQPGVRYLQVSKEAASILNLLLNPVSEASKTDFEYGDANGQVTLDEINARRGKDRQFDEYVSRRGRLFGQGEGLTERSMRMDGQFMKAGALLKPLVPGIQLQPPKKSDAS
ncbi:MAG: hypothetical protein R3C68_17290 [Myxococcota bacterium]